MAHKSFYYSNREVFGHKALFYILLGARGCGKTYSTQNYCLRRFFKHGEKFMWLRLKESSVQKMLQADCKDFIDSKLVEKWGITGMKKEGNSVWVSTKPDPQKEDYVEMARIMALSTFYLMKGVALNKAGTKLVNEKADEKGLRQNINREVKPFKTIVLDEFNKEKSEKKTFDITYAFVNQLENICRLDTDRRIILLGNTLDEASDILATAFNFIPNTFGLYKLKKKQAIIHYIQDSEKYRKARAKSIAGILTPNESTFTNVKQSDTDLLYYGRPGPATAIIKFSDTCYFSLHGTVITQQKQPKHSKLPVIAMRPYLIGHPYYKEQANSAIEFAQQRIYSFDQLLTLKLFYKEIKTLKEN